MPITLYGTRMSPPHRAVLLTARAIGVDIQEQDIDMHGKEEHKTEAFLKMNPTHTVPVLDDNGFCMWESRAIMGYLVQQYGKGDTLYPKEPKKRAVVDNMLYFDADCLFSGVQAYFLPMIRQGKPEDPAAKAMVIERVGFLNTILQDRKYAAGDQLTIADFSIISSLSAVDALGFGLDDFPNIKKWSEKIRAEVTFYDEISLEATEKMRGFMASKLKK